MTAATTHAPQLNRAAPRLRLERTTFRTSRELDFFAENKLVSQTGFERSLWHLVIIKELIDNALDAAEEAEGVLPVVEVTADPCGITVADNGPGLPEPTLKGAMDFSVRVSSREAYVSPARGAQGNALKTLLPMPWILDRDAGKFIVTAHGKRHEVRLGVDAVSQRVVIDHDRADVGVTVGTEVRLEWSPLQVDDEHAWPFPEDEDDDGAPCSLLLPDCHHLVEGFALFNPHATFRLDWFGETTHWPATRPDWKKWRPSSPTSAHWYTQARLERLVGAYVTHDRDQGGDRLVSEFLAEFDGLAGSAKRTKVLDLAGLKRARMSHLVDGKRLDADKVMRLLDGMKQATKPVTSDRLGVIGEEHFKARLLAMGIVPESFQYRCQKEKAKGELPWVAEVAFAWRGEDAPQSRKICTGVNWSSAIRNPFRAFGATGEGLETMLAKQRATRDEPVVFVIHLAHPRVEFADAGKSSIVVGG
jgi:DNA topoisomerase VI subunit B